MDSPELCDLLLFVGRDLEDGDIPHRLKISEMIIQSYATEHQKLIEELKVWGLQIFILFLC